MAHAPLHPGKIKVIVFEFDGVLVRNVERVKDRAWKKLFSDESDWAADTVVRLEESRRRFAHTHGSRYDILGDLFASFSISPDNIPPLVERFARKFDRLTSEAIVSLGIAREDRAALASLGRHHRLYIASVTPEDSLRRMLEDLSILDAFSGVHGGPGPKREKLSMISAESGTGYGHMLFVGDRQEDIMASNEVGCAFVGIANDHNRWIEQAFPLIRTVSGLPELLSGKGPDLSHREHFSLPTA